MTWASFFKSRPIIYGSVAGGLGFAASAGASAFFALNIASQCSSVVHSVTSQYNGDVAISELTAVVHYENYSRTITLNDLDLVLPTDWMNIINGANELPDFCFNISFTIGLCLAMALSLGLASSVAVAVHVRDEQNKNKEANDDYVMIV